MADARRAALRDQTAALSKPGLAHAAADEKRLEPITAELLERLGDALLWRIVVEPYVPKQRGLIASPAAVDDAERILSKVGRVVLCGSMAWKSETGSGLNLKDETNKPGIGDYVLHEMYAGTEIHLTSGHTLRILTETECLMRVKDPSIIRGYL